MSTDSKLEYTGSVDDNGKIELPPRFYSEVAVIFSGKPIVVTVERKRKKRSLNQNAYNWAVVIEMICEAIRKDDPEILPNTVHEFLKARFLKVQKIDYDTGELLFEYSRSTAALKTFEFALYLDNCIQFAAQYLKIVIPEPFTQAGEFLFPEHQKQKETREEYLQRISGYVDEISHNWQLLKYFEQNPDWKNDAEIRKIFRVKWEFLRQCDLL